MKHSINAAIHETIGGLHRIGLVDNKTMREFDETCSVYPKRLKGTEQPYYFNGHPISDKTKLSFLSRTKMAENGCILWTGYLDDRGYGRLSVNKTMTTAQRIAFILSGKVIPDKHWVKTKCNNRKCCNPAHLYTEHSEKVF